MEATRLRVGLREREGERETERKRETDRQTDRYRDIYRDRDIYRETERERDRDSDRQRQTVRQRQRQRQSQRQRQTDRDRHTDPDRRTETRAQTDRDAQTKSEVLPTSVGNGRRLITSDRCRRVTSVVASVRQQRTTDVGRKDGSRRESGRHTIARLFPDRLKSPSAEIPSIIHPLCISIYLSAPSVRITVLP